MPRRRYPSDLTDAQWARLEPLLPFRAWRLEGTWERLNDDLRELVRKRPVSPSCLQPPGGTRH